MQKKTRTPASSPPEQLIILLFPADPAALDTVSHAASAERAALVQPVQRAEELLHPAAPPDLIVLVEFGDGAVLRDLLPTARLQQPDVPLILLVERVDEASAMTALRAGAIDLVARSDEAALSAAIRRAAEQRDRRREREEAAQELRQSHEQLRALTAYLQYVREEERTRIAREMHDELGQMLTNLKIELSWLAGRLPKNRRLLRERARLMLGHIDGLVHTIRQIITELRPGILDELGLVAALEWQAGEFQRRTGVRCVFESHLSADEPWDDDVRTALFRIMQEALNNVLRHAQATLVTVRLGRDGERVMLEISDNGRGITAAEAANIRSIGLLGMRERAALLGGEISIHGTPSRGTSVVIRLPIPQGNQPQTHENSADRRSRHRAPRPETNPGRGIPRGGVR
jgi:signal transduction histidine kinase